jgi:2-keto-4-pentenoate hydratase/2-oxohepta-3-ene-1,7-dioic acid hydratase in catechol pathway
MKLCTFELATQIGRIRRIGAVRGEKIVDINFAVAHRLAHKGEPQPYRVADAIAPSSMVEFIEGGDSALSHAKGAVEQIEQELGTKGTLTGDRGETIVHAMSDVRLLAPIPRPVMLRDYYTFEQHVTTMFKRRNDTVPAVWYELPVHHKQNPQSVMGTGQDVQWPSFTEKFDYELEIACVIGKKGTNVPMEKAAEYIYGYLVMNDFSARDMQVREMACRMGPAKGKDFATSLGPWIVTSDEIADPHNLRMTAKVNGEIWSDGNSKTMQHTFEKCVVFTSNGETILPGEVWGSGTVGGGCGAELERWLKPGDVMELEIEGIGVLRNRVVR